MKLHVSIGEKSYQADLSRPESLAIPLLFDGAQPGFFGAPVASATPFEGGGFVGDTALGGSCNVSEIRLVPHCNGTHTENVGHIITTDLPVSASVTQNLMPAMVVSVAPNSDGPAGDMIIPRDALADALSGSEPDDIAVLIVRTLPNDPAKKSITYDDRHVPAYFAADAMRYIVDKGFQHLLVDIPSIDRMQDEGKLANHRLFWNVAPGAAEAGPATRMDKTVTEMIFVGDAVPDGLYLLDLQVPAWHSDAAPSNPVLYPLMSDA